MSTSQSNPLGPLYDGRSFQELCASLGVTPTHWSVLETVAFQPIPLDVLIHNAMMHHPKQIAPDEWGKVVKNCVDNGWLRQVDTVALGEVASCLAGVAVCDPEAIPQIGTTDFTHGGAEIYKTLIASLSPEGKWQLEAPCLRLVSRGDTECKVACYMTQLCPLDVMLARTWGELEDELETRPLVSTSEPETIGPWCSRWWNVHGNGFRVEIIMGKKDI